MAIMSIENFPQKPAGFDPKQQPSNVESSQDVVLEIQKKRVSIKRERLKRLARGLSRYMYGQGFTNDEESYEAQVMEDLEEIIKGVKKKREQN